MKKLVISTAIAFMMAAPAYADIAVSIAGGSGGMPAPNSVHGWEFTVNTDIILTHLGLYDRDLDGFVHDHDIGLFRLSDGALLTSGTMSTGTGDPLIENFRYIDVVDVALVTTENYVLSYYTTFTGDFVVTAATGEVFAPEVNWISGRWGGTGGLIIPPNSTTEDRYGPNFQFVIPGNCPWDVNGDGVVDHHDLLEVVRNLGPCDNPDNCPWDVNGDGIVNGRDVAAVATHFGACPKE